MLLRRWRFKMSDKRLEGKVIVISGGTSGVGKTAAEEFAAQGVKAPVYASISSSYNVNEVAKKYLPEGTYTLTYQALDPNHNNKVLGNWKYENIKIVQGQNAAEATTEISSINAQKLK